MRAIFVSDGMPGYWLTINPADLNSPIIVILAGVALSCDELRTEARRIRRVPAQMNPVAVAQFFHLSAQVCSMPCSRPGRAGPVFSVKCRGSRNQRMGDAPRHSLI